MKLRDVLILLEYSMKIVPGIRNKKNVSYMCNSRRDFSEALDELKSQGVDEVTVVIDNEGKNAYVCDRTTFHYNLSSAWGLPKNSYIELSGRLTSKGLSLDKLSMSSYSKQAFEDLDARAWPKRTFSI